MRFTLLLLAPLLVGGGPMNTPSTRPTHDRDPWIFRCVLDGNARMIVVSLGSDIWAAYDANACSLVKVWHGDVNLTGPVYDTRHGPQPQSRGVVLLDRRTALAGEHPYQIITGLSTNLGQGNAATQPTNPATPPDVKPAFTYRGYTLKDDAAMLHYENGGIRVDETPSARNAGDGKLVLRRTFVVAIAEDQPLGRPDMIAMELPTSPLVTSMRVVEGDVSQPTSRGSIDARTLSAPADITFTAESNALIRIHESGTFTIETELTVPAQEPADKKE